MKPLRILHLEDDPNDVELVRRTVQRMGWSCEWQTVESGDVFRQIIGSSDFDLVLSDNRIAKLEGIEALSEIQRDRPDVPFIFVSGTTDPVQIARGLAAGARDYISKDQLFRIPSALRSAVEHIEAVRARRYATAVEQLVEVVRDLSFARSEETILQIVRTAARSLLQADGATVVIREGAECHYVDEDAIQPLWKGKRFPIGDCISGWSMLNGEAVVIDDIFSDPRIPIDAYAPTFVKSLVMVPIRSADPIGAIGAYWASRREATEDEVRLLRALADSTSVAFENVGLYGALEQRVRDRTAELEQANSELEAFSYSVSHDLRAPLRALNGALSLLRDEHGSSVPREAHRFLDNMKSSVDRMSSTVDDLLKLSLITRAEVEARSVDLSRLAQEIVDDLMASSPGRSVEVVIAPGMRAFGDPGLLRVALENLLSNAWKYTAKRQGARVEVTGVSTNGSSATFAVRDNGAGFDMDFAPQLFEPFSRLHTAAEFPGIGLGLATVKRILLKHGGEVWAEAQADRGASFYFTLPAPSRS